jgi:hypothetical protein
MLTKTLRACLLAGSLIASGRAFAQNHTITTPGPAFAYSVDGGPQTNPVISMQVGSTNILTINTSPIHPVVIANSPAFNGADRYTNATPQSISSGMIRVTIPAVSFPTTLYYVCSVHGFFGVIDIQGGPRPPPSQILSLNVGTNVVMTSTGTNTTWLFRPEFSSNLVSGLWAPIPNFTNTFSNGTNMTVFNRLDPICGPAVFLRIRQQQH